MALKINNTFRRIIQILGILVLLALIGAIARVLVWEHFYYKDVEGTLRERPTVVGEYDYVGDDIEISDEPIPFDDIESHTNGPNMPRYLYIPSIGVGKTRILIVGTTASNKVDVPRNSNDTAWFNGSALPGTGGTSLIDGHNNIYYGVFKNLYRLNSGDIIIIEMGDGTKYEYAVYENKDMDLNDANKYMSTMLTSPVKGQESLSLITCTGTWNQNQLTREGRIMIRALRVVE